MDNNTGTLIAKKLIQKELVNELYKKGIIGFVGTSNIIKKLDEDISKLEKSQKNIKDMKNIIVKIPVWRRIWDDNESVSN